MSDQFMGDSWRQDSLSADERLKIERGRNKTIKLFLSLLSLGLIMSLCHDVLFSQLDKYNVANVFFRILFEITLFIFLYRGKPWAKFTIIILMFFRVIFQLILIYQSNDIPTYDFVMRILITGIYSYVIYFLLADRDFIKFFADQQRMDLLMRQNNFYHPYE